MTQRLMAVVIAVFAFLVNATLFGLFAQLILHPARGHADDPWIHPGFAVLGVYPAFNICAICIAALGIAGRVASTARALNLLLATFAALFLLATFGSVPSRTTIIGTIFVLAPPALTGWALHLLRLAVAR